MNNLIIPTVVILTSVSSYAQDLLTMKTGEQYQVNVMEITDTEVRFKMHNNPAGPMYTISRGSFSSIRYENGTVETLALDSIAQQQTFQANGYNTAATGGSDPTPIQTQAAAIPATRKEKVTADQVISTILWTGLFALKIAADVQQVQNANHHAARASCRTR